MDHSTLLIVGILGATLLVVGYWQRHLERESDRANLERLRQAQARGADKAMAQHPQIREDLCVGCGTCVAVCPEGDVLGMVGGMSKVILASKCVGHGKCEEACPVGAITIGLGDVSKRPDIPILSSALESSVPGLYIAGELGGIALVRNAVEQGARAVDDIARRLREEPAPRIAGVKDLLVVGAGPAGLSATFRAMELGLDCETASLEDVGGTVRKYPRRKLTLVQSVRIPLYGELKEDEYAKEDLLALWSGAVTKHGVRLRTGAGLESVEKRDGIFETRTTAGVFRSKYVVLALGRRGSPRRLGVPGEESERVLYELADAAALTGQRALIVGGGDSAVEAALGLAVQRGNQVSISYRKSEFFRLKSRNEERLRRAVAEGRLKLRLSTEVASIERDAVVMSILGEGAPRQERLPNDWVFVFAGGEPPFPLLQKMGVRFGQAPVSGRTV